MLLNRIPPRLIEVGYPAKNLMKVIDTLSYRDVLEIPVTDEELEKYELMHKVYMLVRELDE